MILKYNFKARIKINQYISVVVVITLCKFPFLNLCDQIFKFKSGGHDTPFSVIFLWSRL